MDDRSMTPTMINLNTGTVVQLKHSHFPQITTLRFLPLKQPPESVDRKRKKDQPHAHLLMCLVTYLPHTSLTFPSPPVRPQHCQTSGHCDPPFWRRPLLPRSRNTAVSWFSPVCLVHLILVRMCVCVCVCVLSHVWLPATPRAVACQVTLSGWCTSFLCVCLTCAQSRLTPCDPWTVGHQAPRFMQFPRHIHWSGSPCPTQWIPLQCVSCMAGRFFPSAPLGTPLLPIPRLCLALNTSHSTFPSVALLSRPTVKHSYLHHFTYSKLHAEDSRKPHCRLTSTSTHHPSPSPICCSSVPTTLIFCGEQHRRQNSQGRTLEGNLCTPSPLIPISNQLPNSEVCIYEMPPELAPGTPWQSRGYSCMPPPRGPRAQSLVEELRSCTLRGTEKNKDI